MEKITVRTTDIFKAAYLHYCCDYDLTIERMPARAPVYVITGGSVDRDERDYIMGMEKFDTLSIKEGVSALMERTGQAIRPVSDRNRTIFVTEF